MTQGVWLALLLLTGYLTLFESRPRYLVAQVPALLCLALALPGRRRHAAAGH